MNDEEMNINEILEEIKFNIGEILKDHLPSSGRVPIRREMFAMIDMFKEDKQ